MRRVKLILAAMLAMVVTSRDDEHIEGRPTDDISEEGEGDTEGIGEVAGRSGDPSGIGIKLDLKKELDKLRKTNPRLASELRKEHFSNQDFRRAFATPVEAQAAADVLNLVGGEEGISAIQTKADDFANELTMVAEGNPQILDDIVRDTPDGFKKLMGAGLEKLRLLDQAVYERYTAKPLSAPLREKGVINTLEMIRQMALAGKGQEVFDLTQKLLNWAASVEDFAKHAADEAPSDREKSADAKIKQAEQIARKGYLRGSGNSFEDRATNSQIKRYIDPLIRDAAKRGVKLNNDQLADLSTGVYTEIANSLKQNTAYQRQMEAYYAKNADPDEIANYVKGKVSSLAEGAAKKVWGRKGWAIARGKVRTGASGSGKPGANGTGPSIFVGKPPEPQDIDWSKDPQAHEIYGGWQKR